MHCLAFGIEKLAPELRTAARTRFDAWSAPGGDTHWPLHAWRVLCALCHGTAVFDAGVAGEVFEETVGAIVAQRNLTLRVGVEFRLVDAPTLTRVRAGAHDAH